MWVNWLRNGVLDAIDDGFIHITDGTITPVITRPGDIIIAERCGIGGLAIEAAFRRNISVFITGAGGTTLYYWFPAERPWERMARQAVAGSTPRVIDEVARWMLRQRFGRTLHPAHGVNVVRGYEGAEVRKIYKALAADYGVEWDGRHITGKWDSLSPINKTISLCNAALYGLTEIAILHAGYSPFFGFLHGRSGKALVYDIADMVKFDCITPLAFRTVADGKPHPEWRARAACIRLFRRTTLLRELISQTEQTMEVAIESLTRKPSHRCRESVSGDMAKNRRDKS
ncbi:CRISPR-associated endonuclease Cas1 [Salmonella enterica]|uniref:CRISPR-associated endonuclease Cas1 n=1 Tax=Salmonella enterica TaxID=28901 RepID=UPI0009AA59A0|nr:CRISPR-associated endonuclease Cas1 [Salmonella enterica]